MTAFVINQPDDFIEHLKHKENLVVASGQGSLQGQIIRIGHLGFISPDDMVFTIEALERAFIKFNIEA